MFKKNLYKITPYKPGKPIEEVKRQLHLKEVYKLASNEIPFIPYHIKKAINQEILNINRYPEASSFYLREILSKKLKIGGDQLVFGNGSDEIIVMALRALITPGAEVIISHPTFLVYEIQATIEGAKIIKVPLRDFHYDLDAIATCITNNTKLVIIANPDNPTGTYVTHDQVESFLTKIPGNILVFFDEAYFEFAPKDFPKTQQFLEKRGNIIYSRTFSKAYGLAGVRIGYAITTKEIANGLNNIREPFNINRFAQVAAIEALANTSFLKKVVKFIDKEKKYFYRELTKLNIEFVESATNFIMINFGEDTSELNNYLLKNGIIIRELSGWGLCNFFRVTIGTHKENKKFFDCLKKYEKIR